MRMRIGKLWWGAALVWASTAVAQPVQMGEKEFVAAVDECLAANEKTEFDTAAAVSARVAASCEFTATIRFPARSHPVLGDALKYDAGKQQFIWNVQLDETNRFYGGGASPYELGFDIDQNGRPVAKSHPPAVTAALGDIGNATFVLLPLFRTATETGSYEGSNAYGASREVARVRETRYGVAIQIPKGLTQVNVLEVPVEPAKARQIASNLDIIFTFRVKAPCSVCYKADTIERGVRPTITAPIDTLVTTNFVHAELVRFDVIDRVSGRVGYSAGPS